MTFNLPLNIVDDDNLRFILDAIVREIGTPETGPWNPFALPLNTGTATKAMVANSAYGNMFRLRGTANVTGIRCHVTTAAPGNAYGALYNAAGVRAAVSASTALSGPASNNIPFTSVRTLPSGIYWGVIVFSAADTVSAFDPAADGNGVLGPTYVHANGSFTTLSTITPPATTDGPQSGRFIYSQLY